MKQLKIVIPLVLVIIIVILGVYVANNYSVSFDYDTNKVTNIVLDCYPGKNLITNDRNTIDKICANINDARLTCIGYGSGSAEEDIAICIFYEDGSKPKGDIIQLKPDGNVIINNFRYNNTGTPIDYDFLKSLLDNKEDTQP